MDETLLLSFEALEAEHWWFKIRRQLLLEVVTHACSTDSDRILEVGCGTGSFISALQQVLPHATILGVEPNESAVRAATERGRSVQLGSFPRLSVEPNSVDTLLAFDVLEHCEDDAAAVREAGRVLSAGGRLVITVPALPSLWSVHDEINHHYRRYSATTLRRVLIDGGFDVERLTYFNSLLLPIGYATRWLSRFGPGRESPGVRIPPRPLNSALESVFRCELSLLKKRGLPIGMSLLAVAERPKDDGR